MESVMDSETLKRIELRRSTRVPSQTAVALEVPGVTRAGTPWSVETRDANEWGLRLSSPGELPHLPVILNLRAPTGAQLRIRGSIIWTREPAPGSWEAGVHFDAPQPTMSAAQIERARFGG